MLSLYIHIPFCLRKCNFCSFHVIPEDQADASLIQQRKDDFLTTLLSRNDEWKARYPDTPLKTIHIGGGTPFQLGPDRLEKLVDHLLATRDCEYLEELTIELNPDPIPEVLSLVSHFQEKYKKLYKLRFSFGIQTLDQKLLTASKRNYTYDQLQEFMRSLRTIRRHHGLSYNADFIAFGTQKLTHDQRIFMRNVLQAKLWDSISLYTLELFPGSQRRNESQHLAATSSPLWGDDEQIMDEFAQYQHLMESNGYKRYEISNWAVPGKRSIHNMTYWTHGSYLGLGPSASSFITGPELTVLRETDQSSLLNIQSTTQGVRWKNTINWSKRAQGNYYQDIENLTSDQLDDERLMLGLRTDHGISNLSEYSHLLVNEYHDLLHEWTQLGYVHSLDDRLSLTSLGMSVYNSLLTQLIK